jgi:hypothetical protein
MPVSTARKSSRACARITTRNIRAFRASFGARCASTCTLMAYTPSRTLREIRQLYRPVRVRLDALHVWSTEVLARRLKRA